MTKDRAIALSIIFGALLVLAVFAGAMWVTPTRTTVPPVGFTQKVTPQVIPWPNATGGVTQ